MVIHTGNGGQLGNSYLSLFHIIANAMHYRYPLRTYSVSGFSNILNLDFRKLASEYDISVVVGRGRVGDDRIYRKIIGVCVPNKLEFYKLKFISDSHPIITNKRWGIMAESKGEFWVFKGWCLRDFTSLKKHRSEILDLIGFPASDESSAVQSKEKTYNIGIHVRRGDFKEFNNGIYYYSDDVYLRICREIIYQKAMVSKDIRVIVFSNEKAEFPGNLNGVPIYNSSSNGVREDLIGLSKCDLIAGPPSTFSRLASFLGNVPLVTILSKGHVYEAGTELTYLDSGYSEEAMNESSRCPK